MRPYFPVIVLTLLALLLAAVPARADPENGREELVGIVVDGREAATLLVREKEGRFWLPLGEFGELVSLTILPGAASGAVTVETPFGKAAVPPARILRVGTTLYVDQRYFEGRLNTRLALDKEAYALTVDPPWLGRRLAKAIEDQRADLVPEVRPPAYGLAAVHGDIFYEIDDDGDAQWSNHLRATGHAWGGVWQLNYHDDLEYERRLSEAVWMKQLDERRLVQVGHQTVLLHPLIGSVEMTGVQGAWSSEPVVTEQTSFYPGALITRRGQPQRSFAGTGPIGGFAELWVNDRRVARREIGIDGAYEFNDVALPSRQSRIEIRVYDHRNPDAPVDIRTETLELSELLLRQAEYTVLAGAGLDGNSFDRFLDEDGSDRDGAAAFAFARYGLSERATLEGAIVRSGGEFSAMAGGVVKVSEGVLATGGIIVDQDGELGYDVEVDWQREAWRAMLHSYRDLDRGDDSNDDDSDRHDEADHNWGHALRVTWDASATLQAGLYARHDDDTTFVLPFVDWRPRPGMTIRAMANRDGEYRLDARYRPSPIEQYFATADRYHAGLNYTRQIDGSDLTLSAGLEYTFDDEDIAVHAGLNGRELFGREVSWRLGASYSEDGWGLDASLRSEITPGVIGFVEASRRDGFGRVGGQGDDDREMRVRFGVSFDLALGDRSNLLPTTRRGVNPSRGGLSGAIVSPGSEDGLADIPVRIDGQVVGRTQEGGTFFIPNVERGNHIVEFDEEGLPIEYVPRKRRIVAEVAPGAITGMVFETSVEYGAAGRIIDARDEGVGSVAVAVLDQGGKTVGEAVTNSFGYYRVDALPPGAYRLSMLDADGEPSGPARSFTIVDDYVFEVDLTLP